jgi:hypothetical protein
MFTTNVRLMPKSIHFVTTLVINLHITIVMSACNQYATIYDISKFLSYMRLQFVITTTLNEKINERWAYVNHYWWHLLMIYNQFVFAIVFATIHKWLNDTWHLNCYCNLVYKFIDWLINRLKNDIIT